MILHQFPSSHFNEKARWALDYKHLAHARQNYLPGPHAGKIKQLTNGQQTTTPVLEADAIVPGSAAIIDYLEMRFPRPGLYPADPEQLEAALAWQSRLDQELGPAVRTVAFSVFVHEPGFLAKTFTGDKPLLTRVAYRLLLPLVLPIIRKANGADSEDNVQTCQLCVDEYLNEIARTIKPTGYLVGSDFSIADLTAAALLAPLTIQTHPDMRRPQPIPQTMQSLLNAYAEHPTIEWVHRMYKQHRPDPESEGASAHD